MANRLVDRIKRHLAEDPERYVALLTAHAAVGELSDGTEGTELAVCCPAHKDVHPSASFNVDKGVWKCFGCDTSGDIIDFLQAQWGLEAAKPTIRRLGVELGIIPDVDADLVEQMHGYLMSRPQLVEWVRVRLGVSEETLRKFKIGLDPRPGDSRITIPIWGNGEWEDVRRYRPKAERRKVIHWCEGSGAPRIFPLQVFLEHTDVVLVAGEKDAMRAHDMGIENAITVTASEGTLPPDWKTLFANRRVWICFDVDTAGQKGAAKVARRLASVCTEVYIVRLPPEELPHNGDLSDWANLGNGKAEFDTLCAAAERVPRITTGLAAQDDLGKQGGDPGTADAEEPEEDSEPAETPADGLPHIAYDDLATEGWFGRELIFTAHCTGSSANMKEFQLPTAVRVECPHDLKICFGCAIHARDARAKVTDLPLDPGGQHALRLVRVNDGERAKGLRAACGIPDGCKAAHISVTHHIPVQQLILSPPVDVERHRKAYGGRRPALYSGPPVQDGRDYHFRGRPLRDPRTQETFLNLRSARPAKSALDQFTVDDEVWAALEWFAKPAGTSVGEHLDALHAIIEKFTGISGRREVQMGMLESLYSVISFWVGGKPIRQGWVEVLIIGDTRTGKCEHPNTPILMHDGTIKMAREVVVGDRLMGPDSRPRTVRSTCSGTDQMYRIVPTKGEPYIVNEQHILSLQITGTKDSRKREKSCSPGEIVNISVADYLRQSPTFKHCAKGYRVGVEFAERPVDLEPYFLGVWLGDGDSNCQAVTNPDPEIVGYLRAYAARLGLKVTAQKVGTSRSKWNITSGKGAQTNPLLNLLRAHDLIGNKHVPHTFKANSRAVRLEVLAGIIDTDGYATCGCYDLCLVSKTLAEDVVYLARSLGLAAYIKPCRKTCTNTGTTGDYYRISISGDVSMIPVRVARRQIGPRRRKQSVLRTGIKVEAIGEGPYCGWELDGDGLFLLGDFTVTHNSQTAERMVEVLDIGEVMSCEGVTFAGLVVGIEYFDGTPIPVWGAWPRNDRGFLVLDEADALNRAREGGDGRDLVATLTHVRGSGRAEVVKIVRCSVPARVRSVWITNPRGRRPIHEYSYGVRAVEELIPNPQDIARFTKLYCVSGETVSIEDITHSAVRDVDPAIVRHFNRLAVLTWSLGPRQVHFTAPTVEFLRDAAARCASKYSPRLPLVEKGSIYDKLAKLSVPVAVLCGNLAVHEDTMRLTIEPEHAKFAVGHLESTYDSDLVGYARYSGNERKRKTPVEVERMRQAFLHDPALNRPSFWRWFANLDLFDRRVFEEGSGGENAGVRKVWSDLMQYNLVHQGGGTTGKFAKSAELVEMLQELIAEHERAKEAE